MSKAKTVRPPLTYQEAAFETLMGDAANLEIVEDLQKKVEALFASGQIDCEDYNDFQHIFKIVTDWLLRA